MAPGEEWWVEIRVRLPLRGCSVTNRAIVDPFNRIAETNEANNTASLTTALPCPDLVPTIDSVVPGGSATCDVTWTVTNIGTAGAGASTTRVEVFGSAGSPVDVPTPALAASASYSTTTSVPGPCPFDPDLEVRVTADVANVVVESNEANNVANLVIVG
jgi:subtilase family serine protease